MGAPFSHWIRNLFKGVPLFLLVVFGGTLFGLVLNPAILGQVRFNSKGSLGPTRKQIKQDRLQQRHLKLKMVRFRASQPPIFHFSGKTKERTTNKHAVKQQQPQPKTKANSELQNAQQAVLFKATPTAGGKGEKTEKRAARDGSRWLAGSLDRLASSMDSSARYCIKCACSFGTRPLNRTRKWATVGPQSSKFRVLTLEAGSSNSERIEVGTNLFRSISAG